MNLFFCDASALGKRYAPEVGTRLVNHLFATVSHDRLVMLTQLWVRRSRSLCEGEIPGFCLKRRISTHRRLCAPS